MTASAPALASVTLPNTFASLGLSPSFVAAVAKEGYETPTPIQSQAVAPILAGRDMLGCAQTGTGKTAAFVLPTLQRLMASPKNGAIRALVLAPTRELAAQIGERAGVYGQGTGLRNLVIYGGVGQRPQEEALKRKPDLLIATPGRLLDLMQQRHVDLSKVEIFILDEADRMLDMGFVNDVKKVIARLPVRRQTLLFSATVPHAVLALAKSLLRDPVEVSVTPKVTTAAKIVQSVYFVEKSSKRALLSKLLREPGVTRTIVFSRTKHGANRIAEQLEGAGIAAAPFHGNKSQGARERALDGFRKGSIPVLVATDIAARGIDVDDVSHVVNFDLPNVPESYVHRIGRTGRAERDGIAFSFCDQEERSLLRDIERFIKMQIPVVATPAGLPAPVAAAQDDAWGRPDSARRGPPRSGGGNRPGQGSRGGYRNGAGSGGGRGGGGGGAGSGGGGGGPSNRGH
jgi:ATP-dependent RNA helicase RhlE